MTEERNDKRLVVFNSIYLMNMLIPIHSTYGLFIDEFENRMVKELGSCTEEDISWAVKTLDRMNELNAPKPEKKKKAKAKAKPIVEENYDEDEPKVGPIWDEETEKYI